MGYYCCITVSSDLGIGNRFLKPVIAYCKEFVILRHNRYKDGPKCLLVEVQVAYAASQGCNCKFVLVAQCRGVLALA